MKSISEATIQSLGVNGAYERGLVYYNEGRVDELTIDGFRITAEVNGTKAYKVTLHHTAKLFEGECNCPASNNFEFCKHCVAVSLSYYYQTQTNQELAESSDNSLLVNYLNTLTKPELAAQLHNLLLKDQDALDLWQLKAEISSGGLTAASIRKRITKAIPYKPSGLWRYRDVAAYFEECATALAVLSDPLLGLPPSDASKLARYAAQRLEKTLETVDDSGGYRSDTQECIQRWISQIMESNSWQANKRIDFVLSLLMDRDYRYDASDLPRLTLAQVDDEQLNKIFKKVETEWSKLTPENSAHSAEQYYYEHLERLLLERARDQNNFIQEFKILERGAVTVDRCLELVALSIKHDQIEDASRWLNYAAKIKQLSVREVYDIESAQIDMFIAQAETEKALELQWARFEEQEELDLLLSVLKTAESIDQEELWLDKGLRLLESRLNQADLSQKNRLRAETLVRLYISYGRFESAMKLTRTSLLRSEVLMMIVNSTKIVSARTFAIMERATNLHVNSTGQMVYEQAIKFLEKQRRCFGEEHEAQFNRSIKSIFSEPRNLRKTKFIKLLKSAFPESFVKD